MARVVPVACHKLTGALPTREVSIGATRG
jgi:hypothetical protein